MILVNAEDLLGNDDASSNGSVSSFKYSSWDYHSGNEDDYEFSHRAGEPLCIARATQKSTRFCPEAAMNNDRCNSEDVNSRKACSSNSNNHRKLSRIRSLVDVRSQLLHRSLVEEIHKRRLFKTVGAIENIGFHEPANCAAYGRCPVSRS